MDNTNKQGKQESRINRLKQNKEALESRYKELEETLKTLKAKKSDVQKSIQEAERLDNKKKAKQIALHTNKLKYQLGGYFLNYMKKTYQGDKLNENLLKVLNTLENEKEKHYFNAAAKAVLGVELYNYQKPIKLSGANDALPFPVKDDIATLDEIVSRLTSRNCFESKEQKELFIMIANGLPDGLGKMYTIFFDLPIAQ